MADKKWGGKGSLAADYLTLAKQQIDKIWNHEVDHGRGELLLAGDSWGMAVPYNDAIARAIEGLEKQRMQTASKAV